MLSVSYRTVMIVKKACDTNAFIDPVGLFHVSTITPEAHLVGML